MKLTKTLFTAAIFALAVPGAAVAGDIVSFSLDKNELATPESRQLLLDRIEKRSLRYCEIGSLIPTPAATRKCASDLVDQFVKGIDDEALTLLANSRNEAPVRTARR